MFGACSTCVKLQSRVTSSGATVNSWMILFYFSLLSLLMLLLLLLLFCLFVLCFSFFLFDLLFLLLLACLLICVFKFALLLSLFCVAFVFFYKRKCSFHFNGGGNRVKLQSSAGQ